MAKAKLAFGRSPWWAFMEKFEIPDYSTEEATGNYLTRWRLIQTPWFGIYLHQINTPDPRPTLHDHPWNFRSLVLLGGYTERRLEPHTMSVIPDRRVGRFNRVRIGEAHAITRLHRKPTWTLLLVGARRRTWGYWERTEAGPSFSSWTWTPFNKHPHNIEFDKAMARRQTAAT